MRLITLVLPNNETDSVTLKFGQAPHPPKQQPAETVVGVLFPCPDFAFVEATRAVPNSCFVFQVPELFQPCPFQDRPNSRVCTFQKVKLVETPASLLTLTFFVPLSKLRSAAKTFHSAQRYHFERRDSRQLCAKSKMHQNGNNQENWAPQCKKVKCIIFHVDMSCSSAKDQFLREPWLLDQQPFVVAPAESPCLLMC